MLAHITVAVQGEPQLVVPRDAVPLRCEDQVVLVGQADPSRSSAGWQASG